jgi:hypothetical protein
LKANLKRRKRRSIKYRRPLVNKIREILDYLKYLLPPFLDLVRILMGFFNIRW